MNTDEHGSRFICTTNPKILCFLQRIFVRSPASARILFTTKTRKREESQKDFFAFSCLRGEISLVAALLIRVHRCSSVVSFCAIYANENSFRSAKGFSG